MGVTFSYLSVVVVVVLGTLTQWAMTFTPLSLTKGRQFFLLTESTTVVHRLKITSNKAKSLGLHLRNYCIFGFLVGNFKMACENVLYVSLKEYKKYHKYKKIDVVIKSNDGNCLF